MRKLFARWSVAMFLIGYGLGVLTAWQVWG